MPAQTGYRPLNIAIVGGGIGGLAAGISLRRSGHTVTIYEKSDFVGEVGASISCAANGTKWLNEWGVDCLKGDPVLLTKLINRDWSTGEPISVVDLDDYEDKWGYVYWMFHRQYMHRMLKDVAEGKEGKGVPVKIVCNHRCSEIDLETGSITFEGGVQVSHDVVIGADGIGSAVRSIIGIKTEKRPSDSSCLHANVETEVAVKAGLVDYGKHAALEYWGGQNHDYNKIVLSPCNGGSLLSYYCFFPREKGDYATQSWEQADRPTEELLAPYPDLDKQVKDHLAIGIEIRPWRLWVHEPYPYWQKGVVCVMGDAAHPMMPHQSQGACMALEDAAALGVIFSEENFDGDVRAALETYEQTRKYRATRVQAASARASENINERIGFSDNTDNPIYNVADESNKLTIREMNAYDMKKHVRSLIAERKNVAEGGRRPSDLEISYKNSILKDDEIYWGKRAQAFAAAEGKDTTAASRAAPAAASATVSATA